MAYLIVKPTRREAEANRQEALAKRGLSSRQYRGTARTAEEAHDLQKGLVREGEVFDRFWKVSEDSPEAKQAEQDELVKHGIDPESWKPLHSPSTKHE